MNAQAAPRLPFAQPPSVVMRRRRAVNITAIVVTTLAAIFPVAILIYIVFYILLQGHQFITPDFFTQLPPAFGDSNGGMGEAVQGTLILLGLASIVGVPLGLFTGIYLAEYGKGVFARGVRLMVDVLSGLPTILLGLFAWAIIVIPSHGFSALSGGVALGIIMIPIMTRSAEEVLRLVPESLREAALALGIPQWRVLIQLVLPSVASGIITGIIFALARIAGETAPLLMTAFGNTFWFSGVNHPVDALPLRIFVFTESPYQVQINQAYAGSFVLIILIVAASVTIRWATGGFRRQAR